MTAARAGLRLRSLGVRYRVRRGGGFVHAVTDVSLAVRPGRVLALVGESGCGKSTVVAAALGLLPADADVRGEVLLDAGPGSRTVDVLACSQRTLSSEVRGRRVALVPQSAATHLTPVRTARSQLAETVRALEPASRDVAARVDGLAMRAGLDPSDLDRYPHELSGGMAQRVAVAMALAGDPDVVVADEPTTGLDRPLADLTTAALRGLADQGRSVLMVTHDLAAARRVADDVAVMYAGRLLEVGEAASVLSDPWHDYTAALLAALPDRGLTPLPGHPPELTDLPEGCAFHQRVPGECDGRPVLRRHGLRWIACGQGPDPVQDVDAPLVTARGGRT